MPRKRKEPKRVEQPQLPILKLDNVPGPEADAGALRTHYRRVQEVMACRNYDDVINACHWCLDMEAPLAYSKVDEARGTRMFCSGRCASAYSAYQVLSLGKQAGGPKLPAPSPTDGETPLDPEPDNAGGGKGEDVDEGEAADATRHLSDTAGREREREWHESKAAARKPRKARAPKAARADGLCAKGLHKMDEANRYEYNNTVWCRACRTESRARSAAKKGNG